MYKVVYVCCLCMLSVQLCIFYIKQFIIIDLLLWFTKVFPTLNYSHNTIPVIFELLSPPGNFPRKVMVPILEVLMKVALAPFEEDETVDNQNKPLTTTK